MLGTPKMYTKSRTQKYNLEVETKFTQPLKIYKGGSAWKMVTDKIIEVENEDLHNKYVNRFDLRLEKLEKLKKQKKKLS